MPSYLDLAVIILVLISGLLALLRGFTREVLAILSWVAAAAAAYYLYPVALPYIKPYIAKENIAMGVAAAAVFFVALIVVSIFTVKLSDLILDSKVGALDRTLGFIFGAVRGFLLAVVAFVFYGWLVPDPIQPQWVKDARTRPVLAALGEKLHEMMPDNIESIVAKYAKIKKGSPSNEEPPAETETDSGKTEAAKPELGKPLAPEPAEATPGKKTELTPPSSKSAEAELIGKPGHGKR
jgi:membrane protein required for colicin V production